MWEFEPSPVDLLKLMCLFEIFGLPDCSAELVLKYAQIVGDDETRTRYLDVLAAQQSARESGKTMTYANLQRTFARDARSRFSPR